MGRTRRCFLQILAVLPSGQLLTAAAKPFWDTKDPASWTAEEKDAILAQSPWAREGIVSMELALNRGVPGSGSSGMPDTRPGNKPGATRDVPFGEKPPPRPSTANGTFQFQCLARWESAQPVRLAGGTELPEETRPYYAIKLRALPLLPPPNNNDALLADLKEKTRLERKDKPAIPCSHLLKGSGAEANDVLLFFDRGANPIALADKQVILAGGFGSYALNVKFPLKEMLYRGQLAL